MVSLVRLQLKSPARCAGLFSCARDRNRTDTPLRAADFESAASTSFATRAGDGKCTQISQRDKARSGQGCFLLFLILMHPGCCEFAAGIFFENNILLLSASRAQVFFRLGTVQ